jgi:hypothetical protein
MENSLSGAIFDVLGLLTPQDVVSHKKCRIGGWHDGGYVMFEDFESKGPVYSFGIGGNVAFDEDLADRGHQVYMFDHLTTDLPKEHLNFHYSQRGISSYAGEEKDCFTLGFFLSENGHSDRSDMILKMDIEGPEWDILSTISSDELTKFRQIVLEVHWLLKLDQPEFRSKVQKSLEALNRDFVLGHVHANNYVPLGFVGGHPCVDVIELSYIRSDIAETKTSTTIYPNILDASNLPTRPDHVLFFYPYLPTSLETRRALEISLVQANKLALGPRSNEIIDQITSLEKRICDLRRRLVQSLDL